MLSVYLRSLAILTDTTCTSFLSAWTFALKTTRCPSCPFTASGLVMVQFLWSLSLTNVLPYR